MFVTCRWYKEVAAVGEPESGRAGGRAGRGRGLRVCQTLVTGSMAVGRGES